MSTPTTEKAEVLSVKQVAALLDVNHETVLARIADGSLRAVKRGGRWYIRRQWFEEFLTPDEDQPPAA